MPGGSGPRASRSSTGTCGPSAIAPLGPSRRTSARLTSMVVATDLDAGSYSDTPPWTLDDPAALAWRRDLADVRARVVAEVPRLTRPGRWPPGRRVLTVTRRLGAALALWAIARAAIRRAGGPPGRHLPPPPRGRGAAGAHVHQAGADHLRGRGHLPRRAGERVQAVPRPGAGRAVPRRAPGHRGGPGPPAGRHVPLGRPQPAGRRLDRTGPRRHPAHRRERGRQGPAAGRRPARARRPAGHGLAGPQAGGPHSGHRAGQPAGAGGAVRPDHRRGARLPPGGREHGGPGPHLRRARPAGLCRPPTPPRAGHPPGPGHGAARRLPLRRRGRHARRRGRHRGGDPHRHDRHARGGDPQGDLPRRPPRGEPVRPARRAHGAARLRHHRPARRASAPGVPAAAHGRSRQRRPGAAGRPARPGCAAAATPTWSGWCASSTSTNRRSTPRPCRASSSWQRSSRS